MLAPTNDDDRSLPTRRELLAGLAAVGIGSFAAQQALLAQAQDAVQVTADMVQQAAWLSGLKLDEKQQQAIAANMTRTLRGFESMRAVPLTNDVPPALQFQTVAHAAAPVAPARPDAQFVLPDAMRPESEEDLAFASVHTLASLIRAKKISSVELTRLALDRLKKHDPKLLCVVSLTEETALRQADQADREIAAGKLRGPLHGIPWGAKDLISVAGYPTTWGAPQYRDRKLDTTATVVRHLADAGAVLTSKLTVGALAWGDDWFGGITRNPWNPKEGSSGSSAGSCATTAAGLLPFALGSETLGSIVSPCTRCGVTGLRPTFGRVSRHGCMALAWSMDKVGPIARSVADCALIFAAIHGADGFDTAAVTRPFEWPYQGKLADLRVGFVPNDTPEDQRAELRTLRELGVQLVPIELPQTKFPVGALTVILDVEAAAAFDDLTRSGNTDGLNRWPDVFRRAELIPAVEYVRANRIRTLVAREMEEIFQKVDVYVGGNDLVITNLTGHPTVVLPDGFTQRDGLDVPTSLTFTGRLFGESALLAVADAYQRATGFHLRRPPPLM